MLQSQGTGRFRLLESDGICAVGRSITSEDIYINKSTPLVTRTTGDAPQLAPNAAPPDSAYKPTPQKYKGPVGEACVVDRVLLTNSDDGSPTIKVAPTSLPAVPHVASCLAAARSQALLHQPVSLHVYSFHPLNQPCTSTRTA